MPLPPLPTEKKSLVHSTGHESSNRSSNSSGGMFSHLSAGEDQGTDDEDIYSKPMVIKIRFYI